MTIYKFPKVDKWNALIERPYVDNNKVSNRVTEIIKSIKENGDSALLKITRSLDAPNITNIKVSQKELLKAEDYISEDLKNSIDLAKGNIEKYHSSQNIQEEMIETTKGVFCWRKNVAIETIGLYIPGGSAPLFSTILMLGVPAKLVGNKNIILCTPPNSEGEINPTILYTANLLGITKIFKVGGAQAIAAMALGTMIIPKVDKIFGPGNQYVTEAKSQIQSLGVAIDMPAGPSELLVIADKDSNPDYIAADLLSQAEHGADSQVLLLTDNEEIALRTADQLQKQMKTLPRKDIIKSSIENSRIIILSTLKDCLDFSNRYAPEHLILAIEDIEKHAEMVTNAGSVFLGRYSCESAGDYASGTNHTLPTNGYARSYSGVSLDSFVKKITFQKITKEGLKKIGPAIEIMASAEKLEAHKNAVTIRLKTIQNEK